MRTILTAASAVLALALLAVPAVPASAATTYTVTNTNDSGAGSLRQAITDANANSGADTIDFNITGGSAPWVIQPATALPAIADAVDIDGTSQPGFTSAPVVVIDGANTTGVSGLSTSASGVTIQGLSLINWGVAGILVTDGGATIEGDYLGVNATGSGTGSGNGYGVEVLGGSGATIGGTTAAARNVIGGNARGVTIAGTAANATVEGNYVGVGADGTTSVPNGNDGILVGGTASSTTIGGVSAGEGNVIANNAANAVKIEGTATGSVIRGNSMYGNGSEAISNQAAVVPPEPQIIASAKSGGIWAVSGTLTGGAASSTYTFDLYTDATCGQGKTYLTSVTADTNASGVANWHAAVPYAGTDPWVLATATGGSPAATSDMTPCSGAATPNESVTVADFSFTPKATPVVQGDTVWWDFQGPSNHTVTDSTPLHLFDTGATASGGSFVYEFQDAGGYPFHCAIHPSMTGTISAPLTLTPSGKNTIVAWTWQPQTPTGFGEDVQIRKPGLGWKTWVTGSTAPNKTFKVTKKTPKGTYRFRARLRRLSNGTTSGWSPVAKVSV